MRITLKLILLEGLIIFILVWKLFYTTNICLQNIYLFAVYVWSRKFRNVYKCMYLKIQSISTLTLRTNKISNSWFSKSWFFGKIIGLQFFFWPISQQRILIDLKKINNLIIYMYCRYFVTNRGRKIIMSDNKVKNYCTM